jgi:membrane protein implicated in regulation of membrane protease activity
MSTQDFYLLAFVVGFLFSMVSFLGGRLHLPHAHFHGPGHIGRGGLSPLNFGTTAAFLAWFGGTGYLLERYSNIWVYLGLFISVMSGLGGAAIIFWFLVKFVATEAPLDPADYEMVGVLGRVASPIRVGGTGEMIYERNGARCAAPARTEDPVEIPRDTEVVITRFEKGIAYVRRWDEISGERY